MVGSASSSANGAQQTRGASPVNENNQKQVNNAINFDAPKRIMIIENQIKERIKQVQKDGAIIQVPAKELTPKQFAAMNKADLVGLTIIVEGANGSFLAYGEAAEIFQQHKDNIELVNKLTGEVISLKGRDITVLTTSEFQRYMGIFQGQVSFYEEDSRRKRTLDDHTGSILHPRPNRIKFKNPDENDKKTDEHLSPVVDQNSDRTNKHVQHETQIISEEKSSRSKHEKSKIESSQNEHIQDTYERRLLKEKENK